jgi:hypothetical protein
MPPKKTQQLPPKIGTRPKNTERHPGDVVEQQKRKRRTKAEIEANNAEKARLKEEQEEKKMQGVKRIAQIENTVAKEDANLVTPKPSRPKPRPLKRTRAYLILPQELPEDDRPGEVPSDGQETSEYKPLSVKENETSGTGEDTAEDTDEVDESPLKKKGKSAKTDKGSRSNTHHTNVAPTGTNEPPEPPKNKTKVSVRDTIKKARQNTEEDEVEVLSDVTVRPHGNSMPTPKAFVDSHPLTHAHAQRNYSFLLFSEQQ